jgi:hypothetical protein
VVQAHGQQAGGALERVGVGAAGAGLGAQESGGWRARRGARARSACTQARGGRCGSWAGAGGPRWRTVVSGTGKAQACMTAGARSVRGRRGGARERARAHGRVKAHVTQEVYVARPEQEQHAHGRRCARTGARSRGCGRCSRGRRDADA